MPALHRAGAVNTVSLMSLILLVIATVLFSILAYVRSEDAVTTIQGNEEVPGRQATRSLETVSRQVSELKAEISRLRQEISVKRKRITELDMDLLSQRAYLLESEGWILGGERSKGGWKLTRIKVQAEKERLEDWRTHHTSAEMQRFPEIEAVTRTFQQQQQDSLALAAEIENRLQTDRSKLLADDDKIKQEMAEAEEKFRNEVSMRANDKNRLDQRIRELLDLRLPWLRNLDTLALEAVPEDERTQEQKNRLEWGEDVATDGLVLRADVDGRYVVIDIGSKHGALQGMKFEVFQYDKGVTQPKGMIEITEVRAESSTCRVLEQIDVRHHPISRGDRVGSPVFDARRPQVFYLAGEFQRYNPDDLARFIQQSGGQVAATLGPGVDYLVAGDRSEGEQDRGREYHVIALTEDQLVRYLNTTFVLP